MPPPDALSATALVTETGLSPPTPSRWINEAQLVYRKGDYIRCLSLHFDHNGAYR